MTKPYIQNIIPQTLAFFAPDEPLAVGTRLVIVAHEEMRDMHWGMCIAARLAIVDEGEEEEDDRTGIT